MSDDWVRNPDPSPKYMLSASIGLTTLRLRFDADNDSHAALLAMMEILDRGAMEETYAFDQRFWSKGAITLTSPSGAVLRTMLAKGESDD